MKDIEGKYIKCEDCEHNAYYYISDQYLCLKCLLASGIIDLKSIMVRS